jgi:hypothetical protein
MIQSEAPQRRLDGRSGQRTNMFISAALYSEGECCPAKVRNLSDFGALVEASVLPSPGTTIRLCRGSLAVSGEIVWRRGGKAGLRFNSAVTVADWLPNGSCRDQSRVDEIVHQVRTGAAPAIESNMPQHRVESLSISQELKAIASSVERLAETFAADTYVLGNHGSKLQQLEVLTQRIRRIADARSSNM